MGRKKLNSNKALLIKSKVPSVHESDPIKISHGVNRKTSWKLKILIANSLENPPLCKDHLPAQRRRCWRKCGHDLVGMVSTIDALLVLKQMEWGKRWCIFLSKNSSSPEGMCSFPAYPPTSWKASFVNARLAPLAIEGRDHAKVAAPEPIKLANSSCCIFSKKLVAEKRTPPTTITVRCVKCFAVSWIQSFPTRQSASVVMILSPFACAMPNVSAAFLPACVVQCSIFSCSCSRGNFSHTREITVRESSSEWSLTRITSNAG